MFRAHQALSLSDHGEKSLPVSDHGIEPVLWGTDCCHATVVPEQGAGGSGAKEQEQMCCLPAVGSAAPKNLELQMSEQK